MSPASGSGKPGHMAVKTPCGAAACHDHTAQDMIVSSDLPQPLTSSHAARMVSKELS